MSEYGYRDLDGNIVPKSETSRHHLFAQSLTHTGRSKKFINQPPLVPRLLNKYHYAGSPEGLHRHVDLLHPPQAFTISALQQAIETLKAENYYDRLIEFTGAVQELSSRSEKRINRDCGRIVEGLLEQMPYILLGQVEVVEL